MPLHTKNNAPIFQGHPSERCSAGWHVLLHWIPFLMQPV